MKTPFSFGVQSYCFRAFKNNIDVAKKVRSIGLDSIELCAVHADFNQPEPWKETVAVYKNEGVSIISLGVQTFEGNDNEKAWFECAALAGAKHISAHLKIESYMKAIPKIRAWSREFGVRVGLHCHGGYMFGGQPDVIDHLLALGGPELGLCIDTAWCMQIGPNAGNPLQWAEKYKGLIYGTHLKDFTFEPNGQWKDVVVGSGTLDLPAYVRALQAGGFNGMAVIEYDGDVENPEPALKRCVEAMRATLA